MGSPCLWCKGAVGLSCMGSPYVCGVREHAVDLSCKGAVGLSCMCACGVRSSGVTMLVV